MASELDDFRSFIEQRFAAAFPEIDTSAGSVADVEIITPLVSRLAPDPFETPIADFAIARMRSEFPDLVIQKGEPIEDLALKPMRIMLEPFRRQIQSVSRNQSLKDPRVLNDREAEALAANYFASRQQGGFSIGVARIFFNQPTFKLIAPTNAVFTSSGLRFLPVENVAITPDAMLFNQSGSLYFFDVPCRAESQGGEYNIEKGELIGIEGVPEAVKVSNLSRFVDGAPREDIEEFIARVERSLTEKSLVVFRGIQARIFDLFDSVRSIGVIGYGNPEMQRDIVRARPGSTYAFGSLTAVTGSSSIFVVAGNITDGVPGNDNFHEINLQVGDVFRRVDLTTGQISDYTVTDVVSAFQARVTPPPPDVVVPAPFMVLGPNRGQITLSDIPGGIVVPQTPAGELVISNNELHIGGVYDVFIRGGDPQEQAIELIAVRDGEPLHYGLDLETFGNDPNEFVQITPRVAAAATTSAAFVGPGNPTATVYIRTLNTADSTVPWRPSASDVGRYLELLGVAGAGTDFGLYVIQAVGAELLFGGQRAIPLTVSTFDEHTQTDTVGITNRSSVYDLDFRIVESVSVGARVRDRDSPQTDLNGDGDGVGSEIGDSVVIESGADAGIYTVRRILTWGGEHDTYILDRELTTTQTPSGSGDATGFRYRVMDELQVDLVNPRVTKMPIAGVFPADDLSTIAGNTTVTAGGTSNFLLAGIEAGDTLEITVGQNARTYSIESVGAGTMVVNPPPTATLNNQEFTVYRAFDGIQRPMVRVKSVELLDSNEQPTGIKIPYGKEIDARVLGTFSNRANGNNVESFTGSVVNTVAPLLTFEDNNVDFVAQGVIPGNRLEIFEGDSIGEYEIAQVAPGADVNRLLVYGDLEGGKDLVSVETQLHYQIGEPSTGIVRIYFLEPTSVEIDTGRLGGRLHYQEAEQDVEFRFSQVQGRLIRPAPGSGDEDPRDVRTARSYSIGGGEYESILELTDTNEPDVYDSEILVGDIIEVHEQIHFRTSAGLTLKEAGIYGSEPGLITVTGSNRVSIPANSHIDFTQMGDLAGQTLAIETGPDAGIHTVVRVIGPKTLELDSVMTATTVNVRGLETATLYDAEVQNVAGQAWLRDTTDFGQLGNVGDFITIFEAADGANEGTYEIAERDLGNSRVRLLSFLGTFPVAAGVFTWIRTDNQTLSGVLWQRFHIYQAVPKEVEVTQVATKAADVTPIATGTVLAGLLTLQGGAGAFNSVVRGDQLEVIFGVNAGMYPIFSATPTVATVYIAHPFSAIEPNVQYRVWGGLHGSRRMLTVRGFQGSDGRVDPGTSMIYRIRRPALFRISSTELETQQDDSGLYFIDLQVESMGPGDNRNLVEMSRMVVTSGLRADGYTYQVENDTLSFSPVEEVSLTFDRRFLPVGNTDVPENHTEVSGRNLQVNYETSTTTQLIDDLLRSDAERVVCANPLARHFLPSFVFTKLRYKGGSSVEIVGPEIEDYINNLGPLQELEVSDLERFITKRGASSVRHPILLVSVTHDIGRDLVVERSEDAIGGDSVPFRGSARISSFFATLGDGLEVIRG